MKPTPDPAEQLGRALLWQPVHALALSLAGAATLLSVSILSGAALIGVVVTAVLVVALLYWVRSRSRHMVLKTIGVVCGCAVVMELMFLAFQHIPDPYLLVGLILFLGLNGAPFPLMA